jgi:hypothetical protein
MTEWTGEHSRKDGDNVDAHYLGIRCWVIGFGLVNSLRFSVLNTLVSTKNA